MPPAEICNGIDDDCDGVVDQNLVQQLGSGSHVWTSATLDVNNAIVSMVPRSPSGLWLIYQGSYGGSVYRQALDENGAPSGTKSPLVDARYFFWSVASDGNRLVFAGQRLDSKQMPLSLDLLVYTGGLEYVAQSSDVEVVKCTFGVYPLHMAVTPGENGTEHIAITLLRHVAPMLPDGTCDLPNADNQTAAYFATLSNDGKLTTPVRVDFGRLASEPRVARVPCANEWLIADISRNSQITRRYSFEGKLLSTKDGLIADSENMWDLEAVPDEECKGETSSFYLLSSTPAYGSVINELILNRTTSELTVKSPPMTVPMTPFTESQVVVNGGRLFLAGLDKRANVQAFEMSPSHDIREIEMTTTVDLGVPANQQSWSSSAIELTALAWAGKTLVVGNAAAQYGKGADAARDSGDIDPSVAITYPFGCK